MAAIEEHQLRAPSQEPMKIGGVDVEEFSRNLARLVEESGRALAAYLKPREQGRNSSELAEEITEVAKTLGKVAEYWMEDPQRALDVQSRLGKAYLDLWASAAKRLSGEESSPLITPEKSDKRFNDPEWSSNQFYDFLKQAYLLSSKWANQLVTEADGLDPHVRQKAEFYMRQISNAVSPSNFVLTNPELMRETLLSNADNLVRGMRMLAEDIESGGGDLKIRQSDSSMFEVGRNLEHRGVRLPDFKVAATALDIFGEHAHAAHEIVGVTEQRFPHQFGVGQHEVRRRHGIGNLPHVEFGLLPDVRIEAVGFGHQLVGPFRRQQVSLLEEVVELVRRPFRIVEALVALLRCDEGRALFAGKPLGGRSPEVEIGLAQPALNVERALRILHPVFSDLAESFGDLSDLFGEFAGVAALLARLEIGRKRATAFLDEPRQIARKLFDVDAADLHRFLRRSPQLVFLNGGHGAKSTRLLESEMDWSGGTRKASL